MAAFSLAMDLGLIQESPYKLLLHSLSHEHNCRNYNRHVFLFDKWSREYSNGLYIQDLSDISKTLRILRERYIQFPNMFGKATVNILSNLLTKPLLEKKANERKSIKSQDNMGIFLNEVFAFYHSSVNKYDIKINVLRCLSSIIVNNSSSNGNNASLLTDINGEVTRRIADRKWIGNVLYQCGLFRSLVILFQQVVFEFGEYLEAQNFINIGNLKEINDAMSNYSATSANNLDSNENFKDNHDDMEFNELTNKVLLNRQDSDLDMPIDNKDINKIGNIANLLKEMLIFFKEIVHDDEIASNLFECALSNSLLELIKLTVTVRDTFLFNSIDILWTILEAYLATILVNQNSPQSSSQSNNLSSNRFNYDAIDLELAVSVLTYSLNYKLETSSVIKEKEVRNDILIVLSILLRIPINTMQPSTPSVISLYLKYNTLTLFLAYSMMAETNTSIIQLPHTWKPVKSYFDSATEQDLELKRLLWIALSSILSSVLKEREIHGIHAVPSEYTHVLMNIVTSPFLTILLTYLDLDPETTLSKTLTMTTGQQNTTSMTLTVASMSDNHGNTGRSSLPSFTNSSTFNGNGNNNHQENLYFKKLAKYQIYEIQNQATKFIATFATKTVEMLDEFIHLQGFSRILTIIEKYSLSEQPEQKAILLTCLGILQDCFQAASETKSILLGSPLMYYLLLIIEKNHDQLIRTLAVHIVSILCKFDTTSSLSYLSETTGDIAESNTEESLRYTTATYQDMFEHEGGVQLCLNLLEGYCHPRVPAVGSKAGLTAANNFTLSAASMDSASGMAPINDRAMPEVDEEVSMFWAAVVTALWNGIINNSKNLMTFGTSSGIDVTMSLLETSSSYSFRILILRFLSDTLTISNSTSLSEKSISDIVKSQKYLLSIFHSWKSVTTFRSAVQLLLHIWLDEEVRLGTVRPKGIIKDILFPLGISSLNKDPLPERSISTKYNTNSKLKDGDPMPPVESQSNAVSKLNSMILQSRRTSSAGTVSRDIQQQGLLYSDIRGLLANVLLITGVFDSHSILDDMSLFKRCIYDKEWYDQALVYVNTQEHYIKYRLSSVELQVLSIARRYGVFKQFYSWIDVINQLQKTHIKPIESDQQIIDKNYNYAIEASKIVQQEQNEIFMKNQQTLLEEEQKLHTSIIIQKQNDKKAEALKQKTLSKRDQGKKALKTKNLFQDNYVAPKDDDDHDEDYDKTGKSFSNSKSGKNLVSYDDLAEDSSMLF